MKTEQDKNTFSRIGALLLVFCLLFTSLGIAPAEADGHGSPGASGATDGAGAAEAQPCPNHAQHDADCGYVEAVEARPCTHTHDANCGYREAAGAFPCAVEAAHTHDAACGFDGQSEATCMFAHTHDEICGYIEAVEAAPCAHTHDDACGYAEAAVGAPCAHACETCDPPTEAAPPADTSPPAETAEPDGAAEDELMGPMSLPENMPGVSPQNPVMNYSQLTAAITQTNAHPDEDIIYIGSANIVCSGIGNVVYRPLTLIGAGQNQTELSMASGRPGSFESHIIGGNPITLTFKNMTLTGRKTSAGDTTNGGGVNMQHLDGTVVMENCTVRNCHIDGPNAPGAVNGGTVILTNCTVTGNSVAASLYSLGGGVSATNTATLTGCTVTGNKATNGGGVYAGTVNLTNCTVADNSVDGSNTSISNLGGGVYATNTATLTGCTLTGNEAHSNYSNIEASGGGVYATTATLENCTVTGNSAATDGGGVHANTATLENCEVTGNSASRGGGVYARNTAALENCEVTGNTATLDGGGVYVRGDAMITDCRVTGNTVTGDGSGGGMGVRGDADLINCTVAENTAKYGGGIDVSKNATLTGCTVAENEATISGGIGVLGNATLTGCTVEGNVATGSYGHGGIEVQGAATLTNCTLTGNEATGNLAEGGALAVNIATLTNCTVTGNKAQIGPGVFGYSSASSITIRGSIVAGNGNGGADVFGGNGYWPDAAPSSATNYNIIGYPDSTYTEAAIFGGAPTLADNGGPTRTIKINRDGPALNGIPVATYETWVTNPAKRIDQRGITRPQGGAADIGAVELEYYALTLAANPAAGGSVTGGGGYATGQVVNISARANAGYTFSGWTASSGALANASSASTTYTMPGSAVTLTAKFTQNPAVAGVTVAPKTATVLKGNTRQFTAAVSAVGGASTAVNWSVSGGGASKITTGGLLSVGAGETAKTLTVTATSRFDGSKKGTATVAVVNPVVRATGVTVQRTLRIVKGRAARLPCTVAPPNATNKAVSWSSSNPSVATVDASGLVTAVKGGTAAITATTKDGGKKATCTVTVTQPVTSVKTQGILHLVKGRAARLPYTVSPANATNKAVSWSSGNPSVATVDASGRVTAMKSGTATVTVKTRDGNKTANCVVTVTQPVTSVKTQRTLYLVKGRTAKLPCTVYPADASDKGVSWSSRSRRIASVNAKNGTVKGVRTGKTTIYVKTRDGGKRAACTVVVVAKAVKATGVKLNKKGTVPMIAGRTLQLSATIQPKKATSAVVKWSSGKRSVATVDAAGKVTAVKPGTATITAKAGGKSAKVTVRVGIKSASRVSLNKRKTTLRRGRTLALKAKLSPADTSPAKLTWASSNKKVATVTSKGVVKGRAAGRATISAKTWNGKTARCTVIVR